MIRSRRVFGKLFFCMALIGALWGLSACANESKEVSASESGRLRIVVSVFPVYDWVMNILGETQDVEVVLLSDNGTDLHSYQPSAGDLVDIADCDLFIYVGGESDDWVSEALSQYENPDRTVISLMELLGDAAKTEETVEGMQEEKNGWLSDLFSDTDEDEESDEHVWLSLRNAALFTEAIAEAMSAMNPDCAVLYAENAGNYIDELESLDSLYEETAAGGMYDTLLFADRFAFRYLTDDYGLNYYAAFPGCSAETQASFETILFLAEKIDELNLCAVLISESGDPQIAQTVIETASAADVQILMLDSMQSVAARDISDGTTYLEIMKENLTVLGRALGYE